MNPMLCQYCVTMLVLAGRGGAILSTCWSVPGEQLEKLLSFGLSGVHLSEKHGPTWTERRRWRRWRGGEEEAERRGGRHGEEEEEEERRGGRSGEEEEEEEEWSRGESPSHTKRVSICV
ncbi:hypothetical protein NHX12_008820 [Muraenolepis orangiensis]|uniref:Uncharacterized protein n=1 Tax=Muraenolepis orangiensis TaxID=630683 RepID=A0A9Q0DM94_9TELE|nr:hypothetical protein NHX12_008820 [Muraenolepis orangiensis]